MNTIYMKLYVSTLYMYQVGWIHILKSSLFYIYYYKNIGCTQVKRQQFLSLKLFIIEVCAERK